MIKLSWLGAIAAAATVPAFAQTPASSDNKQRDPNKIVCQKEEQIGSRLGAKKTCLTVKEWDERARLNREETERVQQNTAVRSGG